MAILAAIGLLGSLGIMLHIPRHGMVLMHISLRASLEGWQMQAGAGRHRIRQEYGQQQHNNDAVKTHRCNIAQLRQAAKRLRTMLS